MSEKSFNSEYKRILLDTFRYLIDFLNQHNLRWWGAYGTLIGAIRHQGLIPWDDDIDIWMPRVDYEKLISYKDEFDNDDYCIEHISKNEEFAARFAKVMNCKTTIQAQRFIPSVMGVFVDIFPLESCDGTKEQMLSRIDKVCSAWSDYFDFVKHYSLLDFVDAVFSPIKIIQMINVNRKVSLKKKKSTKTVALSLDKQMSTSAFGKSEYCFCLYGYCDERSVYKSEWFDGYIESQYEDMVIRIPSGYHELLSCIYGDYMTPPPIEKRIPRHKPYYINLKERLSLQEVQKRVKAGENEVF